MTAPHTGTRLAAVVLTGMLVGVGCASGGDQPDDDMTEEQIYQPGVVRTDAGDPVDGGTLTVADYAEARSLDPTETYANGASGGSTLAAIYDVLVQYDPDTGEFEPRLARSLTSADNTTWTLKLRDGVEFSNGAPLDAEAVVASIERYLDEQGYQAQILDRHLIDMSIVDERTVEFHLDDPWSTFPSILAAGAGMIVAPESYAGGEFEPIGAGPFERDHYAPSEELVLTAREDYWNGAAHLDRLRFVWLGDDNTKLEALDAGDVDTAYLRSASAVEEARRSEYPGYLSVVGLGSMLWLNNRDDRAGSDVRVRQAVAHALDPEVYYERAHEGQGMPGKQIFADTSPWSIGVQPREHDPDRARELVEEAKDDGFDGTLVYVGQADQTSRDGALAAKAMLEKVGFTVELELLRSVADQIERLMVDHDYDLGVASMTIPDEDPFLQFSGQLHSESALNTSGYGSPEMDGLLAELQAAESDEQAEDTVRRIEELWNEDVPGVGLAPGGVFLPWQEDVHGIQPTAQQLLLFDEAFRDE